MNETQNSNNQDNQNQDFKKTTSLTEIDDKVGFCVTNTLFGTTAATSGNYNHFFTAPFPCEVKKILVTFAVIPAGNCRLQLQKLTSGTASPAGGSANIMPTNLRLDIDPATGLPRPVNTPITVEYPNLVRDTSACKLKEGDRMSMFIDAGSPAGMENLTVTVYLTPSGRGHYI